MSEPWLSAEEIAAHLGVTKDTVCTWDRRQGVPPTRSAGCGSSRPARSTVGFAAAGRGQMMASALNVNPGEVPCI